jgi:hypothetical protein
MIWYRLNTHELHKPVELLCSYPLKYGVRLSGATCREHDINAVVEKADHFMDCVEIVLKVGIKTNDRVTTYIE